MTIEHGGDLIADVLSKHGIPRLFTLCGGHISPILTGATRRNIDVVDVRDEVSAVFAADATARLTGLPGVAAVTAGPGVTNTVTAVKNAQMAQSPVIIFGGASPTVLKGRGALQDIDQLSLMKPITKWAASLSLVKELQPAVEHAIEVATGGAPGPVFLEVPVDLLYPEELVREWFMTESGLENAQGLGAKALKFYLKGHLMRQFRAPANPLRYNAPSFPEISSDDLAPLVDEVADQLMHAERPALVIGSQALVNYTPDEATSLAHAVEEIGIPTFLAGGARGLLGQYSDLQFRHKRSKALRSSDFAIIAGFPFDFRLKYGQCFGSDTTVCAANLSRKDLTMNRKPDLPVPMHPGNFLRELSYRIGPSPDRKQWFASLKEREDARDAQIEKMGEQDTEQVNAIEVFQRIEEKMADDSVLVVDGGDFVATGAYVVRPRKPLSWLDPGVFGTLGVGGGFAVGAALARPEAEVWLIWGDGSSAYSLAEFDTCIRHGLAPIAVIGTDAAWAQIAREQVEILESDVACTLRQTEYHRVAEGYGGEGILVTHASELDDAIDRAKSLAADGKPVVLNIHISQTDFRKGSISM